MMLDRNGLLEAFAQLTGCCYHIWNWKFDPLFNVIESDCPKESLYKSLFLAEGRRDLIEKHLAESTRPIVCTVGGMLSWITAFEKKKEQIVSIYIKGPFFTGYNDPKNYKNILCGLELAETTEQTMLASLRELPMLTSSSMMQFSIMLHYCLTGEAINANEVAAYSAKVARPKDTGKVLVDQFRGTSGYWNIEQKILDKVRAGDDDFDEVIGQATTMATGIYEGDKKSLEFYRQNIQILLTLVSRTAAEAGLSRKTAFSLCADYRRLLNRCTTIADVAGLSNEILGDYAQRVKRAKQVPSRSKQIRICCEYIDTHEDEKLTLEYLAEKVGYTEYHLSRKFHQEMGMSIIDYIQRSKIEKAKLALVSTPDSIAKISEDLGFGSRSYFSYIFKEKTGNTPSGYRKEHQII